jgi:hypothetical protein
MSMRSNSVALIVGIILTLAGAGRVIAQDAAPQSSQAQGQPNPRHMVADRQLQRLIKILNLTPDQQGQIKPLLVDRQQELDAVLQDHSIPEEERGAKAKKIVVDAHGKIEAALTAEQKPKFASMLLHVPNSDNQ